MVIVELVRSISTWAGRVVLVNGHGGNLAALRAAVSRLRTKGREVASVPCATSDVGGRGDAHAGFTETSLMLQLRCASVRAERAEVGNPTPVDRLLGQLARDGVAVVSTNGVLGDPTGATAAEGARLLEAMAAEAAASVLGWQADETGRLSTGTGSGR